MSPDTLEGLQAFRLIGQKRETFQRQDQQMRGQGNKEDVLLLEVSWGCPFD
jgi:hypothetical protein